MAEQKNFDLFLSPPHLSGRESIYINEVLRQNWIAPAGPQITLFEQRLADKVGVKSATALSSGTAGIHLALKILGVGAGDEVLCSTFTFAGGCNPILYCGARPVFIDSELKSWNMDPDLLGQALEDRRRRGKLPKAIIVVDLYGMPADLDRIISLAREFEVPVIEDAAEALGSAWKGRPCGSFGEIGVLSFNGNKIITTSGGGALLSNNTSMVARARFLSTQAREPAEHYEHHEVGFNYRLSNVCAAIGLGQLEVLKERVFRRREIFNFYRKALPGLGYQSESVESFSNRWLTAVTFENARQKVAVHRKLFEHRIESRPLWKPMHLQPVYAGFEYYGNKVSEYLFERGLCLPSGTAMGVIEQDLIVSIIRQEI